ncbi:MAG: hypothetical protein EHM28_08005 [Spirochaetaceae bacterium]|nr:MAG: hypothetical protein EHM28_08005 [Spirochaetaceae bacterium]
MKIAQVDRSAPVKNFLQMWNEAVAPQLEKVWNGTLSAEQAMKNARVIVDKQKFLVGTWW